MYGIGAPVVRCGLVAPGRLPHDHSGHGTPLHGDDLELHTVPFHALALLGHTPEHVHEKAAQCANAAARVVGDRRRICGGFDILQRRRTGERPAAIIGTLHRGRGVVVHQGRLTDNGVDKGIEQHDSLQDAILVQRDRNMAARRSHSRHEGSGLLKSSNSSAALDAVWPRGRGHHAIHVLCLLACAPAVEISPPPADAPATAVALAGAAVLIGTGDIASCTSSGDEATAQVVDSVLKADSSAGVENYVFTLGDNVYPSGSARDFERCWKPSWGDTSKRIMKWIRPSPGNHEHDTDWAAPYYRYFGDRAGEPGKGYYSYKAGEWHVVVLNSVLAVSGRAPAADRRAQEEWLRKDLAEHRTRCTVAYFHHPRFSSGTHGGIIRMEPIWRILHEAGVDLVFAGHDHHYERFLPQGPDATLDTLRGITQILVGTGGGTLRGLRRRFARNSAARVQGHFGVLKVTLGSGEYRHAFLDVTGRVWDRGGGKCH